jgi:hypothetical protein
LYETLFELARSWRKGSGGGAAKGQGATPQGRAERHYGTMFL